MPSLSLRCAALAALSLPVSPAIAQNRREAPRDDGKAPAAQPLRDIEFPEIANGDGRQKLSDFRGEALVVVTFGDNWGQTDGSDAAIKMLERHGRTPPPIVLMSHTVSGGPDNDAAARVAPFAWAMRRYPGNTARWARGVKPDWEWIGSPPFYAVIGPDGTLVRTGDFKGSPKDMTEAVDAALALRDGGFGDGEEVAVRALLYGKGDLAGALALAQGPLRGEVEAHFARRCAIVDWLRGDGQWLRAKDAAEDVAAAAKGVESWAGTVGTLLAPFATEDGQKELALDAKLTTLLRPLAKKAPDKGMPKKLRDFAEKNAGTSVGARAGRLAVLVEQAVGLG